MTYRALVAEQTVAADGTKGIAVALRDLPDSQATGGADGPGDGEVVLDVLFSSVNYKDGMLLGGRPGIARTSPLVAGIDAVGTVAAGGSPAFSPGDLVVLNGAGLGESRDGGLAERVRVPAAALVRVPDGISAARAAAIGTAGFTAMLSVLALERGGVAPGSGDVLVTGAGGGVGSVAVALLAGLGHRVVASTGRVAELGDRLRALGAAEVIDRSELGEPGRPLQGVRWAGAVDSVGSATLVNVLAQTRWGGVVTAAGLAQGPDLPGTVLPFILRAVTLAGINSVEAPAALRREAWARLATDLDLALLDSLTSTVPLDGAIAAGDRILAGASSGRVVVDVRA
jgi:acrylyl-CoA reductase (NADPH)